MGETNSHTGLAPLSVDEQTVRLMIESCDERIKRASQERAMLVALLPDNKGSAAAAMTRANAVIHNLLGRK